MVIAFGLYSVVWGKSKDYGTNPAVQSNTTVKDEAQELPITNANAMSGAKLVIDKNSIDQPSQMQLKTVQI